MSRINQMTKFRKVTHVIFDMDGVLLDTEELYSKAFQNILSQYGKNFDWALKLEIMGRIGRDIAKYIIKKLDLPITEDEWLEMSQKELEKIMPTCEVTPDSEGVYRSAIAGIAKRFGKVYTPQVMGKVVGTPERESSRIAVTEMKLPISVENFQKEFRATANRFLGNVPLMPGARKLVTHLHQNNIPIAVATSSGMDSFKVKTERHKDFFKLFSHIICGGSDPNVKNGKPAPDIFLHCASLFSNPPNSDNCLVFEDSPNGVTAAVKAGMHCVMIPDENVPEELTKDADVIVKSLDETDLSLFGLPPIKN